MTEGLFASEAPKYWAVGLPIVPVQPGTKKPDSSLRGWQGYLGSAPSDETKSAWLTKFSDHGVGLLLGHPIGDGTTIIALDNDEVRFDNALLAFLGFNRVERRALLSAKRGKKGLTIFLRAPIEPRFKSTTITGAEGLKGIDVLCAGKMTVMPYMPHMDTAVPYQFVGNPLPETDLNSLVLIGKREMSIIRAFVSSEHTLALLSGEETHNAGLQLVLALVKAGATDDEISNIVIALLPVGYDGNSLHELPGWIEWARANSDGNEGESGRESQTSALVTMASGADTELFNDGDGTAYATITADGFSITHRVLSGPFRSLMLFRAYKKLGKPVGSGPLNEAIQTIAAKALYEGPSFKMHVRLAGDSSSIEIDRGTKDGSVVRITPEGWQYSLTASHKFIRGVGCLPLPQPIAGGDLRNLQTFLGLDPHNFRLIVAFLLNALKPTGPYFVLLVEGEQGSGKSFFCEIIKRIIDPNVVMRLHLPDKTQDLLIQAKEYCLLNYDNASSIKPEMSDALCALSTGGGIAVRKLYTDGDLHAMSFQRPFIVNGIAGYASRPDLMERAIPIRLAPLPENGRKTEAEMLAEFEVLLPSILGALYQAAAVALRDVSQIEPPRHLRMADAARWIKAGQAALGEGTDGLIDAIEAAQTALLIDAANDEPLVMKLRAVTRHKPFEGTVGDLFIAFDFAEDRTLARSPALLSKQLKRLRPAMKKAGVHVEFLTRSNRGQGIRITSEPTSAQ